MEPPWEKGVERAERLLGERGEAREVLVFYRSLLIFQKSLFASLEEADLSGSLLKELPALLDYFAPFLDWVSEKGSTLLRSQAKAIAQWGHKKQEAMLLSYWRGEETAGGDFFPKAFLQPYAGYLANSGKTIEGRGPQAHCPFCGARPQVSYLQSPPSTAGAAEGARRHLVCSLCFTDWPVNRISCARCAEIDPYKLPYYQSEKIPAVRVEACDTCRHYIKCVDLTRDGLAVPLVDEIATPALDLWAQENGYRKIEMNLAGV